jgi:hypothetical protein
MPAWGYDNDGSDNEEGLENSMEKEDEFQADEVALEYAPVEGNDGGYSDDDEEAEWA